MRKQKNRGLLILMAIAFLMTAVPFVSASTTSQHHNVVLQEGADPFVYQHSNGYYYSTVTTGANVTLWRSRTLSEWDKADQQVIFTPSGTGSDPNCKNVWAPEIHFLNGKWYVYYSAQQCSDPGFGSQRTYVLENASADPLTGTWTLKGQIYDPANDYFAIDGTVLQANGQLYFLWSGSTAAFDRQNLYIASMSNPWTLSSGRTMISTPTLSWETNGGLINEGPQVAIRNNLINIVYSASSSATDDYALGLLTADIKSNLLSASSWTKKSTPVFSKGNGIYGQGHHSFTKSPDRSEHWIVYHAAKWSGAGWNRLVRAQRFFWNADNTPNFGSPVAPNSTVGLPYGEPVRERYEAENATLAGGATSVANSTASNGFKVGYIDYPTSYVQFSVPIGTAGTYLLKVRAGNGTLPQGTKATMNLSVNGGSPQLFETFFSRFDDWVVVGAKVQLTAGTNTIRFTKNTGFTELDYIDVVPLNDPNAPVYEYQAEAQEIFDAKAVYNPFASGDQKVGYIDYSTSYVKFNVYTASAGVKRIFVRYGNGSGGPSSHKVSVNGAAPITVNYGSFLWDQWKYVSFDANLNAGNNTIEFRKGLLFGEIDLIEVLPVGTKYEAEAAVRSGATEASSPKASGDKKMQLSTGGSYLQFTVNVASAGAKTLLIRYGNGNSISTQTTQTLSVNGGSGTTVVYPTFDWNNWQYKQVTVNLNAGANTIRLTKGSNTAELDYIYVAN